MQPENFWNFIFELGQLKRVKHEGWRLAGVERPESVAEHSLRAAQIAYVLAVLEGADPNEAAAVCIWHDVEETRLGDIHRVANRYIEADAGRCIREQTEPLGQAGQGIQRLWQIEEERDTPLGRLAKDADYLEMAATAKEYLEQGHAAAQDWIDNVSRALKTDSAKKMMTELMETKSTDWWQGLKKLPPDHG